MLVQFKIILWTMIIIPSFFATLLQSIGLLRKIEGIKSSLLVTVCLLFLAISLCVEDFSTFFDIEYLNKLSIVAKLFFISAISFSLPSFAQAISIDNIFTTVLNVCKYFSLPLFVMSGLYPFFLSDIFYISIIIISHLIYAFSINCLIISKQKANIHKGVSKVALIIPTFNSILLPLVFLENMQDYIPVIRSIIPQGYYIFPLIIFIRNSVIFIIFFRILIKSNQDSLLNKIDFSELTAKEKDIVSIFLLGSTYKEIAHKLNISPNTVGSHINNIYKKTGTSNRMELYSYLKKD